MAAPWNPGAVGASPALEGATRYPGQTHASGVFNNTPEASDKHLLPTKILPRVRKMLLKEKIHNRIGFFFFNGVFSGDQNSAGIIERGKETKLAETTPQMLGEDS